MGTVLAILFTPKGRLNRTEFATLFCLGLGVAVAAVFAAGPMMETLHLSDSGKNVSFGLLIGGFVLWKYVTVVGLVKRLHDMDMSGFFWLLLLIPGVGSLFYLVTLFAPGAKKENKYGSPSRFFEPRILPENRIMLSA
jgi:uncharacterized membrane protein YhaH (DUF805 family)